MRIRMIADIVAIIDGPANDIRVLFGTLADPKESRLHLMASQGVKNFYSVNWMRAVIEGDPHLTRLSLTL